MAESVKRKVIIVDRTAPSLQEGLRAHGYECETRTDLTYDDFCRMDDDLYGLVIRSRFRVDAPLIDTKRHLRFIVRLGSGVENIDTDYATRCGIVCMSTPEGNAQSVAEHALGMLMAALRHIARADHEVRDGAWRREANKGRELASQRIGIIGYGHTGPAFARILKNFGCEIFVYDKFRTDITDTFVRVSSIEEIQEKCNVISLHINYLPKNHHLVNEDFLTKVQEGVILLNTCRGSVVDTAALVQAVRSGRVGCAALDVLEYESVRLKIPPKEEWDEALTALSLLDNVILTPHIAGQTFEAEQRHADIALQKILNLKA